MKKHLTILDCIIFILFIGIISYLICSLLFIKKNRNSYLLIETNNEKYKYDLYQKKNIEIKGETGITRIIIDNGTFRFIESSCPNKDCVKMGWISISFYPVICLPNKVSAYIISEKKDIEYDGISR